MLYVKFRQLSDILMGNITFIEAYYQFLFTADLLSSLKEDVHRLEGEQPVETNERVFIFTIHDILIAHLVLHFCQ